MPVRKRHKRTLVKALISAKAIELYRKGLETSPHSKARGDASFDLAKELGVLKPWLDHDLLIEELDDRLPNPSDGEWIEPARELRRELKLRLQETKQGR